MEFPWMMFGLSLLIPLVGVWLWMIGRRRQSQQEPPCAIVLLLRAARVIDARLLAELLTQETGRPISARQIDANLIPRGDEPANDTVIGVAPHFIAVIGGTYFMVHNPERPYGGEVGVEHEAWLSMEILHPQAVSRANYQIVGRVLSHMVGEACLALYHPPHRTCVPYTAKTAEFLRAEDPIKALFDAAHS
ncbi:MAG: hypothetical protein ABI972_29975 [Acidobacteriota bacterium]